MNLDQRLLGQIHNVRAWLVLTILVGLGLGLLIVLQALTLSRVIARVFLEGAALQEVWGGMQSLCVVFLARAVLTWASEVSAFEVAARIKLNLRERLLAHIQARGPAYVKGERTGELINTLVEGIEALEAYFSQYLPQLVLAALVPFGILVFVFSLDRLSGLVLLLTGPLVPLFMILIGKAADALTRKQWTALSFMSAHFLDVLQGLTTLKILGRSREQIETIARVSERFRDTTLGVLKVAFLSAFALEMIATISTAIVAVQVGLRLLYGQMLFEQALFLLILAPDFYLPLRLLGTRFHAGMSGVAAGQRIFEILGDVSRPERPAAKRPPRLGSRGLRPAGTQGGLPSTEVDGWRAAPVRATSVAICFEEVYYTYDGERAALDGVSFEIGAGERVALVGPTGAGKSTIVNLLLRFIEPGRGEIRCNGESLCAWSPGAWREQIAWVPQNPYLFDDTVAANIRYGCPNAAIDALVHAAEMAHADEFIRALPQSYETRIGERGARLSGGEAQRIALARAFLKNAPLLILDEATANLDVETAAWIQEATERLMRGRTVLMITHRLNTVVNVDRILVLKNGRIVETGTHAKLMQARGLYHRLVTVGQGAYG